MEQTQHSVTVKARKSWWQQLDMEPLFRSWDSTALNYDIERKRPYMRFQTLSFELSKRIQLFLFANLPIRILLSFIAPQTSK